MNKSGNDHSDQTVFAGDSAKQDFLSDFCGQKHIVNSLAVALKKSQLSGEPLEHMLFYGPSGYGKKYLLSFCPNTGDNDNPYGNMR